MNIYFRDTHERSFGTYPLRGEVLEQAVNHALSVGYRAFDTAQMYNNEAELGEVLKRCGIPRTELCITTKVHPDHFSKDRFLPSVEESLKKLNVTQVDVLLLHWPPIGGDIIPSLKQLNEAAQRGLTKSVGVSNYTANMMKIAVQHVNVPIVTNQVEFHPLLNQQKLLQAAIDTGIPLSSYCSVARGEILNYSLLQDIGKQYGKTAVQVVLRWILQKGVSINTMSCKPENIKTNFSIMDFTLSNIDLDRIDALQQNNYRIVTKEIAPWAPEWD